MVCLNRSCSKPCLVRKNSLRQANVRLYCLRPKRYFAEIYFET